MQVREQVAQSVAEYATAVAARGKGTFQSREMRDEVFQYAKQRGITMRRGTISNQQLHPEYVTDYVGTLETGFGNTQYQTFWSKLYTLEVA